MNSKFIKDLPGVIQNLKDSISFESILSSAGYEFIPKKSTKKYHFYKKADDNILIYKTNRGDTYYSSCTGDKEDSGDMIQFVVNKGLAENKVDAVHYIRAIDPLSVPVQRIDLKPAVHDYQNYLKNRQELFPVDENSYLVKSRGIRLDTLKLPIFQNSVFSSKFAYKDKMKNAIFLLTNQKGKEIGQNVRNKDFEHNIEDSDKFAGCWASSNSNSSKTYAIFENPIDAISYYQLFEKDMKYISTVGNPSQNIVNTFALVPVNHPNAKLVLCGDNDVAGQIFNMKFLLQHVNFSKNDFEMKYSYDVNSKTVAINIFGDHNFKKDEFFKLGLEGAEYREETNQIVITVTADKETLYKLNQFVNKNYVNSSITIERSVQKDYNMDLLSSKKRIIQM